MAADAEITTEEILAVAVLVVVDLLAEVADSVANAVRQHQDLVVLDLEKKVVLVAIELHAKVDLVVEEAKVAHLLHVVKVVFLTVRQELRLAMHQEEILDFHQEAKVHLTEHHGDQKALAMLQDQDDQEKSNTF